jgi:DNA-binding transcriptional ArsR family regulator
MIVMKDHFKNTAALICEPVRATILWTLLDGKAFTATELAIAADTSASNISMHLARLVHANLLKAESHGRHRYYSFSRKEIAYAVEAIAALVPQSSKPPMEVNHTISPVQQCRTCYDHIAGKTGVAVTDALLKQKIITASNNNFELTSKGKKWFLEMDIDTDELQQQRRSFLRPCLDWSERRYHIAGALAAALLDKMFQQDWVRRVKNSRAVVVTAKGQKNLYERLKIVVL